MPMAKRAVAALGVVGLTLVLAFLKDTTPEIEKIVPVAARAVKMVALRMKGT